MPISQYEVLYTLIGTTYGGDGQNTFNLPDLRSRVPVHMGQGSGLSTRVIGQLSGAETVTLITSQLPFHTHTVACNASSTNLVTTPKNNLWAQWADFEYTDQIPNGLMNAGATTTAGGSQPHENMLPYIAINYIIALEGVFPSQG